MVEHNGVMNGKTNGTPISNGSTPGSTSKAVASAPKPAAFRRIAGGVKVSTVQKVAAPPAASSTSRPSSSSSASAALRFNGLSEEKRQRVEEIRRAREQKKLEEEQALLRAYRASSSKASDSSKASSVKKRKSTSTSTSKKRSDTSDEDDQDDLFSDNSDRKKKNKGVLKRSQSGGNSSTGYKRLGRLGVTPHYLVPRDLVDREVFLGDAGNVPGATSSASLLVGKRYGTFFPDLSEEEAVVTLEYPAPDSREEFRLLVPKDRDEYDPISDLLRTVRCIADFYFTYEQRQDFGSLEELEIGSSAGQVLHHNKIRSISGKPAPSREGSVADSEAHSSAKSPLAASPVNGTKSLPTDDTALPSPLQTGTTSLQPVVSSSSQSSHLASTAPTSSPLHITPSAQDTILRSFTKARNRRDGALFLQTVSRFNEALVRLKQQGKIEANIAALGQQGVPEGIWRCLQEQCYARTVGPRVEELSKYEAFSDNVYGELLPRFMSEISQLTELGADSVFVDLGSGVGNLLIQVGLQSGSECYGCEQMVIPAELSSLQLEEARRRWKMWGLSAGKVESWQGDFGEDDRVRQVLRRADVVLVNNYAFTAPTNDRLSLQFLDLKDGAKVVSLRPFVPADFRLTERTISSPLAILRVEQREYSTGCVSWADGGGKYYIHTVDRSMIAQFLAP